MAAARGQRRKAQPQKKWNQKQPKQPKGGKREKRMRAAKRKHSRKPKQSSSVFVSKILKQLCQGKAPLPGKENENTVFSQRYLLTSQDGRQQCFLSNYVSSQGSCGSVDNLSMPVISTWPYKPAGARWTATMCPPLLVSSTSQLWPERQQQCIFSNLGPSQALYGQMSTLSDKELHYEAPRQSVMSLFDSKPSIPRF